MILYIDDAGIAAPKERMLTSLSKNFELKVLIWRLKENSPSI